MKKLPSAFSVHAVLVFLLAFGAIGRGQSAPIATVALTQGWATFGEVVPQGLAFEALQVGTLATQTDVKTRWPDGSIRFAIVTASVSAAGSYSVSAAPAAAGTFSPQVPGASVTLTIGGTPYTATLPAAAATDAWLNGALVREGRTVAVPATAAGTSHPFLRVNFDTRIYNDGKARIDVSVENVLDKAGATTVTYDATITVAGQQLFTKTGVQHYYLTRWRKVFEVGSTPIATVTPDLAPFNVARALPPYLAQVTNVVNTPGGASYDILNSGAVSRTCPRTADGRSWRRIPTGRRAISCTATRPSDRSCSPTATFRDRGRCTSAKPRTARTAASAPNGSSRSISARGSGTTRAHRAICWTTSRAARCPSASTDR